MSILDFLIDIFSTLDKMSQKTKIEIKKIFLNYIGLLLCICLLDCLLIPLNGYISIWFIGITLLVFFFRFKEDKEKINKNIIAILKTVKFICQGYSWKIQTIIIITITLIFSSLLFFGFKGLFKINVCKYVVLLFFICLLINVMILFQIMKRANHKGMLNIPEIKFEKVRIYWWLLALLISAGTLYYQLLKFKNGQIDIIIFLNALVATIGATDKFIDSFMKIHEQISKIDNIDNQK